MVAMVDTSVGIRHPLVTRGEFLGWINRREIVELMGYRTVYLHIEGIQCHNCGCPVGERRFKQGEPVAALCIGCEIAIDADDSTGRGIVTTEHFENRRRPILAQDLGGGKSSGRDRRHIGSMGDAENGNGCWDNLVRAMEDGAD